MPNPGSSSGIVSNCHRRSVIVGDDARREGDEPERDELRIGTGDGDVLVDVGERMAAIASILKKSMATLTASTSSNRTWPLRRFRCAVARWIPPTSREHR